MVQPRILPLAPRFPPLSRGCKWPRNQKHPPLSTQMKPPPINQHLQGSRQSSIHAQFHIFVKLGVRETSVLHARERSLPSTTIPCSYYSVLSIRTSLRLSVKGLREIHIQRVDNRLPDLSPSNTPIEERDGLFVVPASPTTTAWRWLLLLSFGCTTI